MEILKGQCVSGGTASARTHTQTKPHQTRIYTHTYFVQLITPDRTDAIQLLKGGPLSLIPGDHEVSSLLVCVQFCGRLTRSLLTGPLFNCI